MAVSVKVREDTKRRLDRLQAHLASRYGRKMTLQELVDALTSIGENDPGRVTSATSRVFMPLSEAARKRILSLTFDIGPTSEEDIDRELYSEEAIHGQGKPPGRRRG
ncbi:MAG TPA: hypothetical protein VJ547_08200 [Candidatus Thermoplasmatota archaeon]|nr:hypothetical protein [Candidatus Thermoplasmatota archaeon]